MISRETRMRQIVSEEQESDVKDEGHVIMTVSNEVCYMKVCILTKFIMPCKNKT
jgi:hypothetical protein